MRRELVTEECCYTCQNNRNSFDDSYYCDCEFLGKGTPTQDMYCGDYEVDSEYEIKSRGGNKY